MSSPFQYPLPNNTVDLVIIDEKDLERVFLL